MRLIHTSDLHLGDEAVAEIRPRPDPLLPLRAVSVAATRERAAILLVSGDLFDSSRVGDELVAGAARILGLLKIPVVILPGNHDAIGPDGVYLARAWTSNRPSNVKMLSEAGCSLVFEDLGLEVWGRPQPSHDRWSRPLAGAPRRSRDDLAYVVMAHGHCERGGDRSRLLSPRAAPISAAELDSTCADYTALGHRDLAEDVSTDRTPAWYSGSPFGPGGLVLAVDLPGANVTPLSAASGTGV